MFIDGERVEEVGGGRRQENSLRSDLINCHTLTFTEDGINLLPIFIITWRSENAARLPRPVLK